jgi:multidrug efflux pump subunit AcrB
LTVTPYLGYHLLQEKRRSKAKDAEGLETSQVYKIYNRLERPLLESSMKRRVLVGVTVLLLIGSVAMFFTKSVLVKMLPFDNKMNFK